MQRALQNGPWFINGYFLSVKRWQLNFFSSEARENVSAILIRLPELLTKFYDHTILAMGGEDAREVGQNGCMHLRSTRRRYARICVEVAMGIPVKETVYIGNHKQSIVYEGSDIFCNKCGVLGHNIANCMAIKRRRNEKNDTKEEQSQTSMCRHVQLGENCEKENDEEECTSKFSKTTETIQENNKRNGKSRYQF